MLIPEHSLFTLPHFKDGCSTSFSGAFDFDLELHVDPGLRQNRVDGHQRDVIHSEAVNQAKVANGYLHRAFGGGVEHFIVLQPLRLTGCINTQENQTQT